MNDNLEKAAVAVIDMFDQANTNDAIVRLGSRGQLLQKAISDMRKIVNTNGQKTILGE